MYSKLTCLYLCLFSLLIFQGCIEKKQGAVLEKSVSHPYENSYIDFSEFKQVPLFTTVPQHKEKGLSYFFGLEEKQEIGAFYEPKVEVFGQVEYIALSNGKEFFVLDSKDISIKKYDVLGNYLSSIGRKGRGPGELMQPLAMELMDNGLLVVADSYLKLEVFDSETGDHVFTKQLKYSPQDACSNGNTLYIYATSSSPQDVIDEEKKIHTYELSGNGFEYVESFGMLYPTSNLHTSATLSRGRIECLPSGIITASKLFPFIEGYATSGELLWKLHLEDFAQREIVSFDRGGYPAISYSNEDKQLDNLASLVSDEKNSAFYVQYVRATALSEMSIADIFGNANVMTLVIEPVSGKVTVLADEKIAISAISSEFMISEGMNFIELYPLLDIYRRTK